MATSKRPVLTYIQAITHNYALPIRILCQIGGKHKNRKNMKINYEILFYCRSWVPITRRNTFFLCVQCPPPHVLVDFVVLPPGHGSSVTDFRGWDAHKAQLRCADDVTGDIGGWSARRALKPKFY